MKSEQINSQINNGFPKSLLQGDCIELLSQNAIQPRRFCSHGPAVLGALFIPRRAQHSQ